mmetsp:Transcript_8319/g.31105  ORF Transcript_8319/g.31105 Transcript_8319/m.31105 type:complete len:130 (+) Transcript_8319:1434-1823(+)
MPLLPLATTPRSVNTPLSSVGSFALGLAFFGCTSISSSDSSSSLPGEEETSTDSDEEEIEDEEEEEEEEETEGKSAAGNHRNGDDDSDSDDGGRAGVSFAAKRKAKGWNPMTDPSLIGRTGKKKKKKQK